MKDHYLQVGGESLEAGILLEPLKAKLRVGVSLKVG